MIQDPLLQSSMLKTDEMVDSIKKLLDNYELGGGALYLKDIRLKLNEIKGLQTESYLRAERMEKAGRFMWICLDRLCRYLDNLSVVMEITASTPGSFGVYELEKLFSAPQRSNVEPASNPSPSERQTVINEKMDDC